MASRAAWLLSMALGCAALAAACALAPAVVAPVVSAHGGTGVARDAGDAGVGIAIAADAAPMKIEGPFPSVANYCDDFQRDNPWTPDMVAGACGGGPAKCEPQAALDPPPGGPWRSAHLVLVGATGDISAWSLAAETSQGTFVVELGLVEARCDDSQSVGHTGGYSLTEEVRLSARVRDAGEPELVVRSVERALAEHPLDPACDHPDAADQLQTCEVVCRAQGAAPVCLLGCGAPVDKR